VIQKNSSGRTGNFQHIAIGKRPNGDAVFGLKVQQVVARFTKVLIDRNIRLRSE
jgi:hypothetical protein